MPAISTVHSSITVCMLSGLVCLAAGCSANHTADTPGPDARFGCTEGEVFGDLTLDESRCLCGRSVDGERAMLRSCFGKSAYAQARAACDSKTFMGYEASCDIAIDDWLACRKLLVDTNSCDELEEVSLDIHNNNLMGCGELLEAMAGCLVGSRD